MSGHTKGIICIILAAIGFSLMSFFVRLAGDLPTMEKAFFRNFVALIVAVFVLIGNKTSIAVPKGAGWPMFFRCFLGSTALIANFYAIDRIGLADSNMLNKLSPFFAILVSIPLLKEKPKAFDIISTVIAFIGALLIIRPTQSFTLFPSLIGLYGGFGAGTAYACVRLLGRKNVKSTVIVFYFSSFSCLLTLPFFIIQFEPMTWTQLLILMAAGVSATLGQFGITNAYKFAPAKDISVFDYTQVIFAALWSMIFFAEIPVPLSIAGYIIIIGIAVVRWWKMKGKAQ